MVKIRKARVQDSAALAQVQVDSYRTSYASILPQAYLDHFSYQEQEQDWRELLSSGSDQVLNVAATEAGQIVGYALGRPGPTGIPPYDGELVALHVVPAHRGQGIARLLIAAVAADLEKVGCQAPMLWVLEQNPARALYEGLGGQVIGEKDWEGNAAFGTQVKEVAYGWSDIAALAAPREPTLDSSPPRSPLGPSPVARMQSLILEWERASNRRVVFLSCYQMMTSNVLAAIEQREFHDAVWVRRFLYRFADYYFVALEAYERDPATAPRVWQLTHSAAQDPRSLAIQNLLLGVNAHINYDLVLTLLDLLQPEWHQLSDEERAMRYADHCYINKVLARTIDSVQDQVLEPAMPAMALVDSLLGPLDELMISRLITQWRETVWDNAVRLLEAETPEARTSVLHQVEEDALSLGKLIRLRG